MNVRSALAGALRHGIRVGAVGVILSGCAEPPPIIAHIPEGQAPMKMPGGGCAGDFALDARFAGPVDPLRPDTRLMAEALHRLVNRERCLHGLSPVGLSKNAVWIASEHALSMAAYHFTGHHSPVPGRETLKRRLAAGHLGYRWAAENVARAPAPFLVGRRDGCLAAAGQGAPTPSYRDAAEGFMALWMASPGHRSNILDPRGRMLGAGIGVDQQAYACGEIAAAMVFVG